VDALVGVVAILSPGTVLGFEHREDGLRITHSAYSDQRVLGAVACAIALSLHTDAAS
jgi:hypothetical protein